MFRIMDFARNQSKFSLYISGSCILYINPQLIIGTIDLGKMIFNINLLYKRLTDFEKNLLLQKAWISSFTSKAA
jgi:hypothetical protein